MGIGRVKLEGVVGEIVVAVELENGDDRSDARRGRFAEAAVRREVISGVVDTGARMLALPQDVVDRLGLAELERVATSYADGRRGELSVAGPLILRIGGRRMQTECLVVPTGAAALVGQIVLERLDLIADCANQTLGPRPESPDRPLLRV